MAVQTSLPELLDSLSHSLNSALDATPKLAGIIEPTKEGVSLLDVKNELLLSYLQNLVFRILLKIRNAKNEASHSGNNHGESPDLSDTVVKKLVELRLYLDKGVRPLEEKLRFQLDKILRAADNADRSAQQAKQAEALKKSKAHDGEFESGSEEDSEDDDEDAEEADGPDRSTRDPAAKSYVPGAHGFIPITKPVGMAAAAVTKDKTGVYRPPKIAPTVMPTTERRERAERRPMKSATMDEYVSQELSAAPLAQPSVGADIVRRGRGMKTATERAEEERRREYEETNFVRLPSESKKDKAKRRAREEGRGGKMTFGGEEWRELGEGVDRISRLTARQGQGASGGTKALLEKSRKRGRETTDSARGSGLNSGTREIGERFNKKVKVMEGGRRDRGKR
ncbi:hypothetical protein DL768_007153 [Monosporascus sp. mg162]|nr:hypothetical protein DL768_007153 [Monosporascus sp. mg162]